MRTRHLSAALVAVLLVSPLAAQPEVWSDAHLSTRISRAALDSISARGRELAAYDAAAWHGTDAVLALRPPNGAFTTYLARHRADGLWEVVFGTPGEGDGFHIAYRALQASPGDTSFRASAVDEVERDYFARAARARDAAAAAFGRVNRPYNLAVFPVPGTAEWYVYLFPAATRAGYWPLGADARFRVSADGRTLREARRMHNAVIEYGPPPAGAASPMAFHTALLDDRPEDSDVFLVLQRLPASPEYIASRTFYFRIDTDGRITAYDRDEPRPPATGPTHAGG